jgi:hypothetical protein
MCVQFASLQPSHPGHPGSLCFHQAANTKCRNTNRENVFSIHQRGSHSAFAPDFMPVEHALIGGILNHDVPQVEFDVTS